MRKRLLAQIMVVLAGFAGNSAALADDAVLATVRVEIQIVSVPVPDARLLIPALQDGKTADEAFARIQDMLRQEKVVLLGWPVVWVVNDHGTEAREPEIVGSASVEELRYPTEFNPPDEPGGLASRRLRPTWGPSSPTAFETRGIGTTIYATADVESNGRITLRLTPEFVRLIGFKEFALSPSSLGIEPVMTQPEMRTSKTSVTIRVRPNQPVLVGSFIIPEPEPRAQLFIARARAVIVPPGVTGEPANTFKP